MIKADQQGAQTIYAICRALVGNGCSMELAKTAIMLAESVEVQDGCGKTIVGKPKGNSKVKGKGKTTGQDDK